MKANFTSKQLELAINLYQALVLLCFNDANTWTLPQIQERTGILDRGEAERILQSLSMGKIGTRVLVKVDVAKDSDRGVSSCLCYPALQGRPPLVVLK